MCKLDIQESRNPESGFLPISLEDEETGLVVCDTFLDFLSLFLFHGKNDIFDGFYSLHKHTSLKITWKKENLCLKVKINKWLKTCFTVFKNYKNVSLLLNLRAKNPKFTLPKSNISRIWIFAPKIQKLFFGPKINLKINLMDHKLNFVQVWDILSDFQNTVLSWTLFSALEKNRFINAKIDRENFLSSRRIALTTQIVSTQKWRSVVNFSRDKPPNLITDLEIFVKNLFNNFFLLFR